MGGKMCFDQLFLSPLSALIYHQVTPASDSFFLYVLYTILISTYILPFFHEKAVIFSSSHVSKSTVFIQPPPSLYRRSLHLIHCSIYHAISLSHDFYLFHCFSIHSSLSYHLFFLFHIFFKDFLAVGGILTGLMQ